MHIKSVILQQLRLPLLEPFVTSYGVEKEKEFVLVFVETENALGVGECVALSEPLYSAETYVTAWYVLERFFVPQVLGKSIPHPEVIHKWLAPFRGHEMAKAALEAAIWDAYAGEQSKSLYELIGGVKNEIPVGISIGMKPTIKELLLKVNQYLQQGYQRIKVKIAPQNGYEILYSIRREFGDIPLMADANSAYTLADIELLKQLDELNLLMIEQPLGYDDLVDHAKLQSQIQTPICLDESIRGNSDVRKAIELGSCKVVNLKIGRVGGISESLNIENTCRQHQIQLWCGGMFESGIGRLMNLVVTSLPGFTLPGDTGPSHRYFAEDIIEPPVEFSSPGMISVPKQKNVFERINHFAVNKFSTKRNKYSLNE